MQSRPWLALIWTCFVVRCLFYAGALPAWEGFDEYAHYGRIEFIAEHLREPDRSTPLPDDVAQTFLYAPSHNGGMSFDEFWKLPAEQRGIAHAVKPQDTIYEAQQPPLFYWLMTPVYYVSGSTLITKLLWLRVVCVLLASLSIPVGFLIGRAVFSNDSTALAATALIAAMPVASFTATHVGNDSFAIAFGALVVFLALRGRAIFLGFALGAGLLTKAYFLAFLPAVALMGLRRENRKGTVISLGISAAISGWWYWITWRATRSITGNILLVRESSLMHILPQVPWGQLVQVAWSTFVWTGNWSFLFARGWMYRAVGILAAVACAGVVKMLVQKDWKLGLCAAFVATFALGILYYGVVTYALYAIPGAVAWYACCLTAPIAVLLIAGLRAIVPDKLKDLSGPVLVVSFTAIELFGTNVLMLPYYAGFISHLPNGGLPACSLSVLIANSGLLTQRLTLLKPAWISGVLLSVMWLLALCSSIVLAITSVLLGRIRRN